MGKDTPTSLRSVLPEGPLAGPTAPSPSWYSARILDGMGEAIWMLARAKVQRSLLERLRA